MRTAAKMLLAGLCGGASLAQAADPKSAKPAEAKPGVFDGLFGKSTPAPAAGKVVPATATAAPGAVQPAVGYSRVTGAGAVSAAPTTVSTTPMIGSTAVTDGLPVGMEAASCANGTCGHAGHGHGFGHARVGHGHAGPHFGGPTSGYVPSPYGPTANGLQIGTGHAGIMPAPAMGPYGAVAAVGAFGPGAVGPLYANQRTSIRYVSPAGMRVTWQTAPGVFTDGTPLEAPARYNYVQGNVYRLKLTNIANRPGLTLYPTLEVYPATPRTITFLSHSVVPVGFSDEDLDQIRSGNLVVKVIYLPNDAFQDFAVLGGLDEVVSTRLEPGVDPIVEANRRGTILAVVRVGNIDLEDPNSPRMDGSPAGPAPVMRPVPVAPLPAGPAVTPSPIGFSTPTMPTLTPVKTPAALPNAVKLPAGK